MPKKFESFGNAENSKYPIKVDNRLTQQELDFIKNMLRESKSRVVQKTAVSMDKLQNDILTELQSRLNRNKNRQDQQYIQNLTNRVKKYFGKRESKEIQKATHQDEEMEVFMLNSETLLSHAVSAILKREKGEKLNNYEQRVIEEYYKREETKRLFHLPDDNLESSHLDTQYPHGVSLDSYSSDNYGSSNELPQQNPHGLPPNGTYVNGWSGDLGPNVNIHTNQSGALHYNPDRNSVTITNGNSSACVGEVCIMKSPQ